MHGVRQQDPMAGMSGDDRCRMLCFGIRDAAEVFTGNSIFADDAYWNVSATSIRSFGCLQCLYWSVSEDDWVRALVKVRAYATAYLCAGPLRADPWRSRFEFEVMPWTR